MKTYVVGIHQKPLASKEYPQHYVFLEKQEKYFPDTHSYEKFREIQISQHIYSDFTWGILWLANDPRFL